MLPGVKMDRESWHSIRQHKNRIVSLLRRETHDVSTQSICFIPIAQCETKVAQLHTMAQASYAHVAQASITVSAQSLWSQAVVESRLRCAAPAGGRHDLTIMRMKWTVKIENVRMASAAILFSFNTT